MKEKLVALLLGFFVLLSGCSQRTADPSTSQAGGSPTEKPAVQSPAKGPRRPVFWQPIVGTDVFDLRAAFPAVIPTYLPEGYVLQFWSVGTVSTDDILSGEDVAAATAATLVLGPAGKPNLVIMESKADLCYQTEEPVTKNGDGSETWSNGFETSVLFQYLDMHVLVMGRGMAKEELMKIVASMKLR